MRTGADVVQVWLVDVDDLPRTAVTELSHVLDDEERRRADCLASAESRRRYIAAHGAARFVVAGYLGASPGAIRWKTGRHGKPELAGAWSGRAQVNLSHSGGLCLVALSGTRRVGVDVQRLVSGLEVVAMADRYFSAEEALFVAEGCDAADRAERFAWLWARKEAVVKAEGGRLTQVLPLSVQGDGDSADIADIVVELQREAVTSSQAYRVADVPAPRGFRAAVALSGREGFDVVRHRWSLPDVATVGDRGDRLGR